METPDKIKTAIKVFNTFMKSVGLNTDVRAGDDTGVYHLGFTTEVLPQGFDVAADLVFEENHKEPWSVTIYTQTPGTREEPPDTAETPIGNYASFSHALRGLAFVYLGERWDNTNESISMEAAYIEEENFGTKKPTPSEYGPYVIEHESRGVFVGFSLGGKPRFKYSIIRSEGRKFQTLVEAMEFLEAISVKNAYVYGFPTKSGKLGQRFGSITRKV